MTKLWEFHIYVSKAEYDNGKYLVMENHLSKKEAMMKARQYVKNNFHDNMIVLIIRSNDIYTINMYSPIMKFGQLLFMKFTHKYIS